jgi:predicted phage tail protein
MVSAARHRYRRPALTITGLTLIDAALFQHGWFAGLLATGISVLVFEWLGADDEPGGDA